MSIIQEIKPLKSDADDSMIVVALNFSNNDKVKEKDELIELETSKTTTTLDASCNGYIEYKVKTGDMVDVDDVVICIHDKPVILEKIKEITNDVGIATDEDKIISNAALKYINENKINIKNIKKQFITLSDVKNLQVSDSNDSIIQEPNKLANKTIRVQSKPVSRAKKIEIKALSQVQTNGLVSTIAINVEAIPLEESDTMFLNTSESYLPVITYEVSRLLSKYKILNSYYETGDIKEYIDINIGIALDIDNGLKVYNIRNCNKLNFKEIKDSITEGIYHYLRKTLNVKQITESTFTITDLSAYNVSHFTPLINAYQSAILGISSVDKKLQRFTLSLTFDHRVTEGKVASEFLNELGRSIKNHSMECG